MYLYRNLYTLYLVSCTFAKNSLFCLKNFNLRSLVKFHHSQGVNVKKLFEARAFVPGKPFQPSLMFAGEARSLP
jgi:hypothetical protein